MPDLSLILENVRMKREWKDIFSWNKTVGQSVKERWWLVSGAWRWERLNTSHSHSAVEQDHNVVHNTHDEAIMDTSAKSSPMHPEMPQEQEKIELPKMEVQKWWKLHNHENKHDDWEENEQLAQAA